MMSAQHTSTGGSATRTATDAGQHFRACIAWAVDARAKAIRFGWSRVDAAAVRNSMRPLEEWLSTHHFISMATAKELWRKHQADIRYVMPGNAAGRKRMHQLENIITGATAS